MNVSTILVVFAMYNGQPQITSTPMPVDTCKAIVHKMEIWDYKRLNGYELLSQRCDIKDKGDYFEHRTESASHTAEKRERIVHRIVRHGAAIRHRYIQHRR